MAAGGEEKTEEPTTKKKSDARKKGNIPRSKDMTAALTLLGAITLLKYIGPYMGRQTMAFMIRVYERDLPQILAPEGKEAIPVILDWFVWIAMVIGPFLVLMCFVGYVVNLLQVGFLITFEQVKFNLNKLNPVAGLKRIFTTRNLVMLVMNLAKMSVVMAVAWYTVFYELQSVIAMVGMETVGTFIYTTSVVLSLAQRLAILLLALGLVDFYYQKWKHNKDLKMTKQEIKEEFKQMEGDPVVKQKRRQKQMQMAMQRMMQEVPQAEVVVRNPTHFAVAISYKPGMAAPMVVAKGKDRMAEKIIEQARASGVPLVENPPLARQLYKVVEVGDQIPEELFATVAEVLTSVMDAEKKRKMMESMAA